MFLWVGHLITKEWIAGIRISGSFRQRFKELHGYKIETNNYVITWTIFSIASMAELLDWWFILSFFFTFRFLSGSLPAYSKVDN